MESYFAIKVTIIIACLVYGGILLVLGYLYRSDASSLPDYKELEKITTEKQREKIARLRSNAMICMGTVIFISSILSVVFNMFALAFFIIIFTSLGMLMYLPQIRETVIYGRITKNTLIGIIIILFVGISMMGIAWHYYKKRSFIKNPPVEKISNYSYNL